MPYWRFQNTPQWHEGANEGVIRVLTANYTTSECVYLIVHWHRSRDRSGYVLAFFFSNRKQYAATRRGCKCALCTLKPTYIFKYLNTAHTYTK